MELNSTCSSITKDKSLDALLMVNFLRCWHDINKNFCQMHQVEQMVDGDIALILFCKISACPKFSAIICDILQKAGERWAAVVLQFKHRMISGDNHKWCDEKIPPYCTVDVIVDILARAAVPSKATVGQAIDAVKEQIIRSLCSRAGRDLIKSVLSDTFIIDIYPSIY